MLPLYSVPFSVTLQSLMSLKKTRMKKKAIKKSNIETSTKNSNLVALTG